MVFVLNCYELSVHFGEHINVGEIKQIIDETFTSNPFQGHDYLNIEARKKLISSITESYSKFLCLVNVVQARDDQMFLSLEQMKRVSK